MEEIVDELWQVLNSDEPEHLRLQQAKELVSEWAMDNNYDLPEIREFDLGDDEEDTEVD